jgi:hypothetical protein
MKRSDLPRSISPSIRTGRTRSPTRGVPFRLDREDTGSRTPFNARGDFRGPPAMLFQDVLHKHHATSGEDCFSICISMSYIRLKSAISGRIRRQKTPSITVRRVLRRGIGRCERRAPLRIRSDRAQRGAGESDHDSIASPIGELISNGLRPRENSQLRRKANGKNESSSLTAARIRFQPRQLKCCHSRACPICRWASLHCYTLL